MRTLHRPGATLAALLLLIAAMPLALFAAPSAGPLVLQPGQALEVQCAGDRMLTGALDATSAALACVQLRPPATVEPAPESTATAEPSVTVEPSATAQPTATALPTATLAPTLPPATATPQPTATQIPTTAPTATLPPATGPPTPTATPQAAGTVLHRAWFYTRPSDGTSLATVAQQAGIAVVNTPSARDELRRLSFTGPIARYVLGHEVEGRVDCSAAFSPLGNQVAAAGEFCALVNPNEDWFLHNGRGERLYLEWFAGRPTFLMNPASPGWRDFALERMQSRAPGFEATFLDNIELDWYKFLRQAKNSDGVVKEFASNDAFRAAMVGYLQALAPLRQNGAQLWVNLINDPVSGSAWDAYLPHVDGVLQEGYATTASSVGAWERMQVQAARAIAAGKHTILVSTGALSDATRHRFAFASYLLIADGQAAAFRYSPDAAYTTWPQLPEYQAQLGQPLGPRVKLPDGRWQRQFERGIVTVDPAARISAIEVYP